MRTIYFLLGVFAVFVLEGLVLFGPVGARTVAFFIIFFVAPFYFILDSFRLDTEEKVYLSLFIGIGFIGLAIWLINRAMVSFKFSSLVALSAFFVVGLLLKLYSRKRGSVLA